MPPRNSGVLYEPPLQAENCCPAAEASSEQDRTSSGQRKLDPANMAQFTGSETFYCYGLVGDVLFTEGVKYVADTAGAYWLLDIICIANAFELKVRAEEFQLWTLKVRENASGVVTCDDGNSHIVYEQALNLTDFPESGIDLYFCNGTILLPSEYRNDRGKQMESPMGFGPSDPHS
jgi:hypothetical protein